jgi:hypothetical protein
VLDILKNFDRIKENPDKPKVIVKPKVISNIKIKALTTIITKKDYT